MDPNVPKSMFLDRFKEDENDIEELSRIEECELLKSPKFKRLQSSSPPRSSPSSPSKSNNNNENSMFESVPDLQWRSPQILRTPTKQKSYKLPLNQSNRKLSQPKFSHSSPTKIHAKLPEMRVSLTPAQRLEKKPGRLLTTNDILSTYEFKENVGKGAFANVYRAINKITGDEVAVKEIFIEDDDDILELMSEIDLLKILKHHNIVKYHGFIRNEKKLFIFLEYCSGGSLRSLYKKSGPLTESLVVSYIKQVLNGLIYLHEQGVVHRDVKAANILLTSDGDIKLTDFGVSTKVSANTIKTYSIAGTPNWMAPEIISMDGTSTASDIWSVGATVVELLAGEPLYAHLNEMAALHAIVTDEFPPIPQFISAQCKDFLLRCFEKQPSTRVTARELLKHDWLTKDISKTGKVMDSIMLRHKKKLKGVDSDFNCIKRFNTKKFLPVETKTFKYTEMDFSDFIDNELADELNSLDLDKHSTKLFDPLAMKQKSTVLGGLIEMFQGNPSDISTVREMNTVLGTGGSNDDLTADLLFTTLQTIESTYSSKVDLTLECLILLDHLLQSSTVLIQDFIDLSGMPLLARLLGSKHQADMRHSASEILRYLFDKDSDSLCVLIQCGGLKSSLKLLQEDYNLEPMLLKFIVDVIYQSFENTPVSKKTLQMTCLSFPNFLDWIAVLLMHCITVKDVIMCDNLVHIICFFQGSRLLSLKSIFLNSIFKIHDKLSIANQVKVLKFLQSVNVNEVPESLNMVKFLVTSIKKHIKHPNSEMLSLVCSIIFSVCHLNSQRQIELIRLEILPAFQELLNTALPCTEFVIPLLCEFSLNNHLVSKIVKEGSGVLQNYLELLIDPVWQANALDALISLHEQVNDDQIAKLLLDDDHQFLVQSFLVEDSLNYELYTEKLVKFLATYSKSVVVNQIRLLLLNSDKIIASILERIEKYKADLVVQINLFKLLKVLSQENDGERNHGKIMNYLKRLKKTNILLVDQLISETLDSKSPEKDNPPVMGPPSMNIRATSR